MKVVLTSKIVVVRLSLDTQHPRGVAEGNNVKYFSILNPLVVVKEDWPLFVHTLILRQLWRLTKAARRSDEASFRTTEKAIAAIC